MRHTVVLFPGQREGDYVAYVPASPGCVTPCESVEDAIAMAQGAASALTADMTEMGQEVPTEPTGTIVDTIEVPAADAAQEAAVA